VIVDDSADSREVLHVLLNCRGVPSVAVKGAREGLELVRQHLPSVVVLDLDADEAEDEQLRDELVAIATASQSALVVLGKSGRYLGKLPDDQVIAKPYHYKPLLHIIERLLTR
jgi:CheY-like chemotaxis protein